MNWRQRARALKQDVYALYFALRDPRTPWYAKAFSALVVAYAFSPIDLIPDPIPVIGHLDDIILIPLGVSLAIKLIPAAVLANSRIRAHEARLRITNWIGAAVVVVIWVAVILIVMRLVAR